MIRACPAGTCGSAGWSHGPITLAMVCALTSQWLMAAWIGATDLSSQTTALPE